MVTRIPSRMILPSTIDTTRLARQGTAGQALLSQGAGADPAYGPVMTETQVIDLIRDYIPAYSSPGRRQTVLFGPVNSNGHPNLFPGTGTGLTITTQNLTTTPLVLNFANGARSFTATISTNLVWTGLANDILNYLFIELNPTTGVVTTGSTRFAPDYRFDTTYSVSNLQATFSVPEMVMKIGNGSAAVQRYVVFVGEALTAGGNVTATVSYAYGGKILFRDTPVLAAAAITNFVHNIGCYPLHYDLQLVNVGAEWGYTAAQRSRPMVNGGSSLQVQPGALLSINLATVVYSVNLLIQHRTAGTFQVVTPANWRWWALFDRGW